MERFATVTAMPGYLQAATDIARQLVHDAVPQTIGVTWEGDDLIGTTAADSTIVRGPVGVDLYGGTAGIGWFLAHVAAVTAADDVAAAARAALAFALARASATIMPDTVSLYAGATGVALAAIQAGARLGDAELEQEGLSIARRIADAIRAGMRIRESDLIAGKAGVVIGLLAIARRFPDRRFDDACMALCDELIETRRSAADVSSWLDGSIPALCGLGHGASGIAWALAEAAWATRTERFRHVADEALRYERSWFLAERCAWPDLREPPATDMTDDGAWPGWTTAWCHGALGIGAVRLRLFERDGSTTAFAEASAAIQAARSLVVACGAAFRQGSIGDVTLCHGLGGAIELALLAHEILGLEEHRRAARRVGTLCLQMFTANGRRWTCGLPKGQLVPGLLLGLAGIGVTMLRLHDVRLADSPLLAGRDSAAPERRRAAQKVDCQASGSA